MFKPVYVCCLKRFALATACAATAATAGLMPANARSASVATAAESLVPPPLPSVSAGSVERKGARIWYGVVGKGPPVVLLHGGLASSSSWGAQVRPLVRAGYRVILIDSRGHGRSELGSQRLTYRLMAEDVEAVIARLRLRRAALVGWSDGAIVALTVGIRARADVSGVFAFGANVDASGVRADAGEAPVLAQVGPMLAASYAASSTTPENFDRLRGEVRAMQAREPRYSRGDLQAIRTRTVEIAGSEDDEFVRRDHQAYIATCIPDATLVMFRQGGHFVPWREPAEFNRVVIAFLARWSGQRRQD